MVNNTSLEQAARKASAATIGLVLLCGVAGIGSAWQQNAALSRQQAAAELLRNHMNADMMHDAIRADVFAALQARDQRSRLSMEEVRKELAEHVATLKANIATDTAFKGSPPIAAATGGLVGEVEDYAQNATRIAALAASQPLAADAELPAFIDKFHRLEDTMEAASDAISAHSAQVSTDAGRMGWIAIAVLVAALLAGVGGALALGRRVRMHVVQPLSELVAAVTRLAGGDRTSPVGMAGREDELGALATAIDGFRGQLNAADQAKDEQTRLIVDSIGSGLDALAAGDLTTTIDADLPAPFDRLRTNFNAAMASFRQLIGSVKSGATSIRSGSDEITQASEDLARRTEINAASLEQTSSAVAQIDARIRGSAEAATQTVARADATIATVATGRDLADQAVGAMGRVADSARGIDEVIEGLDKIAFQTRVLAMNATVEAGRAGEAGLGFAVVADLVSALAMRSEEEARRARAQLNATSADVVAAVEAVQKVDLAFTDISGDVRQVHEFVAQMAIDNQAQSTTIAQIAITLGAMDTATQQNAAMAEQASAAARNLSSEVLLLSQQAGEFRIDPASPPDARDTFSDNAHFAPVRPLPAEAVAALTPPNKAANTTTNKGAGRQARPRAR